MSKLSCYAVVVPGLESIAAEELTELSAHEIKPDAGGVHFTSTMDGLFRINLRSRCCTRILIRLAQFKALSFPELYNKTGRLAWHLYVDNEVQVDVRASCSSSKLMHSGRTELAVADAIADVCQQRQVAKKVFKPDSDSQAGKRQQVLVRLHKDMCTISLDTSGERLDRRGYRLHSGKAPVRETIAAAILRWMDWQTDQTLLTPMCGSATFAIEAAWMAQKRASGLNHDFPFMHWPSFKQKRWQRAVDKATGMQTQVDIRIFATELDAGLIKQAGENIELAAVADAVCLKQLDVRKLSPPENSSGPGLIVCNPPYGDRIKGDMATLYKDLGRVFRTSFPDWRIAVIVPDQACEKALGLKVRRRLKIKHGGKWVYVLQF